MEERKEKGFLSFPHLLPIRGIRAIRGKKFPSVLLRTPQREKILVFLMHHLFVFLFRIILLI